MFSNWQTCGLNPICSSCRPFVNVSSIQQPHFLMNMLRLNREARMRAGSEDISERWSETQVRVGGCDYVKTEKASYINCEDFSWSWSRDRCQVQTQRDQPSIIRADGNWRATPQCFINCLQSVTLPQKGGGKDPAEEKSPEVELELWVSALQRPSV